MTKDNIFKGEDFVFWDKIYLPEIRMEEGKTHFIFGPSGCGKTTLLGVFNGTVDPQKGKMLYRGEDIQEMNTITLRKEILLIGQKTHLFPGTIEENFEKYYGYLEKKPPAKEEMGFYLDLTGNIHPLDRECPSLSEGEKKRVFLAIYLSLDAPILLMDEPTAPFDKASEEAFFKKLTDYGKKNNKTLIIVSHQLEMIEKYGERIISLGEEEKQCKPL